MIAAPAREEAGSRAERTLHVPRGVRSACSVSAWELTETYSPVAIDIAPATNPAVAATITADLDAPVADTPTIRLAVETIPSFAPSTAARSHPMRFDQCSSRSKDFLPQGA